LGGDDPFSDEARRTAGPVTLRFRRVQLRQLASALVHSGRYIATITRLADLVEIDAAKQILTFFWGRNGQRKIGQLHNLGLLLVQLANHWVNGAARSDRGVLSALRTPQVIIKVPTLSLLPVGANLGIRQCRPFP
jgi:hypothetical protein